MGSRHPINPGSRDLNSLWPSPVTGSKTNSSSCKLSITGKAGGGWPRAGEEGGPARSCYPPRGRGGTSTPGCGAAGPPPFVSPHRARSLNPLRSAVAQLPKPALSEGRGLALGVRACPRVAETRPLAGSREVWSWYYQAPGGGQPPSLPRGCWMMGGGTQGAGQVKWVSEALGSGSRRRPCRRHA